MLPIEYQEQNRILSLKRILIVEWLHQLSCHELSKQHTIISLGCILGSFFDGKQTKYSLIKSHIKLMRINYNGIKKSYLTAGLGSSSGDCGG